MKRNVFELAAEAWPAIRALQVRLRGGTPEAQPVERVRVVKVQCPVCGKMHRMGLGEPRCTAPVAIVSASQGNPAYDPIFRRALAAALLCGCMALSGCTHFYVSGVSVGAGETSDGKEITASVSIAPNPYGYAQKVSHEGTKARNGASKAILPLNSK